MKQPGIGDPAPDFSAVDHEGRPLSLKDFKGSRLILYFYPKDDTPGCTAEACNLRDNYQVLKEKGFRIVGVSADDEYAHQKFISKHALPFALIPDKAKKILRDYGAWGMKKMYGKEYEGILRKTFIISTEGIIENIIEKVDTKDHAGQILREMGV